MNNMLNFAPLGVPTKPKGEITNYNINSNYIIAESKNGLLIQLSPTYNAWISKKFVRTSQYNANQTNFGISTTFDYELMTETQSNPISGIELINFLNDEAKTYGVFATKVVKKNVVHQVQIPK